MLQRVKDVSDFWITVEYALSLLSMKIPLILSFISIPFSLLAQFYTISPTRIHADSKPESIQLPVIIDSVAIEPSEIHDESQDTVSIQWCHPPLKGKLRVSSQYGNRRNPFGKKTAENIAALTCLPNPVLQFMRCFREKLSILATTLVPETS